MTKKKRTNIKQPIKQLLNFVEKQCEEYDISEFYTSILAINGNDKNRLIDLAFYVDSGNKKEILEFIQKKGNESAIKKRILMALNSILTGKRDKKYYEIEYRTTIENIVCAVGALKFHSQDNVRIISREYDSLRKISIIMVEGYKKKVEQNTGKYNNRLEAAAKIKYYYLLKDTKIKFYL
ncbi:MAG: hypothetical protein M3R27_12535 [Bacteroidota bacterium]|nr:hypothetical protein [Bacteroidota bacterium]